jgi:hypothetical protein
VTPATHEVVIVAGMALLAFIAGVGLFLVWRKSGAA